MRNTIIILSVFALITSSCIGQTTKNASNEINAKQINEEEQNDSIISSIQFDWEKVIALKNNTIKELKKKEKSEDKIIMSFLNEYSKLADEFSEILFNNENYDLFNTLIWNENYRKADTLALDFKSEVETNGFSIAQSEGMIYIAQNTDFIKLGISPLVNSLSIEFINLYANEIDNICCDDAAIIISTEELVNRVYKWGELSKKVAELEYNNHVEYEFYSNLYLLFYGVENTPSFDWETKKYNTEAIDLMNEIIKKYSISRAAAEFIPFIELLENENFKETEKVKEYWKTVNKK